MRQRRTAPYMFLTDAGRKDYMPGEMRDCTVRAFATAFRLPYETAHRFISAHGRKIQRRWKCSEELNVLAATIAQPVHLHGITLERMLRLHPEGRFYCAMRGHAFAIVDGKVHDAMIVGLRSVIKYAWEVPAEGLDRIEGDAS